MGIFTRAPAFVLPRLLRLLYFRFSQVFLGNRRLLIGCGDVIRGKIAAGPKKVSSFAPLHLARRCESDETALAVYGINYAGNSLQYSGLLAGAFRYVPLWSADQSAQLRYLPFKFTVRDRALIDVSVVSHCNVLRWVRFSESSSIFQVMYELCKLDSYLLWNHLGKRSHACTHTQNWKIWQETFCLRLSSEAINSKYIIVQVVIHVLIYFLLCEAHLSPEKRANAHSGAEKNGTAL
jgi:hypothetical protein